MNKTEIKESLQLIAQRTPPGDRWTLEGETEIRKSITDALEAYYQKATSKPLAYRLEPIQGNLFAIRTSEVEIPVEQPKQYSIYGDYEL
jgi:hypothetical protein